MTTETILLTAADLFALPDDGRRHELLDEVLVEMAPTGSGHGCVSSKIVIRVGTHVEVNRLGEILSGDPGIALCRNPDRARAPDVCFIAADRVPAGGIPKTFVDVVPDLIVEVISPNDTAAMGTSSPGVTRTRLPNGLMGRSSSCRRRRCATKRSSDSSSAPSRTS